MRKRFNGGLIVEQTAFCGFNRPRIGIAVAVEDDALVFLNGLADEVVECFGEIFRTFEFIGKLL